ncbi:MAG TPA: DUF4139 domain-containing protein [Polyangiaceae bacterium]|nr:DUF4139 domain-containing protein [Polyangiaceae bacterium]
MSSQRIRTGLSLARYVFLAALGWSATSVAAPTPAPPPAAAPTVRASEAGDRRSVSITVYNSDFGLVREVRQLKGVPKGRVALEFRDVASTIQPETVAIKALQAGGLRVLEQNYRFDLLTPETLLEKYVGRSVRAYRYHEATAKEDVVEAKLLSVANGPILQIGSEITFNYPGRLAFSELPPNLIAKPTLVWLVDSAAADPALEVSYLAAALSWSADYVLVLDAAEKQASLVGWVTLVNNSGASYRNAALQLVAGDVNRVQPPRPAPMMAKSMDMAMESAGPQFREEGLLEYHLYSLERPTDVLDREQKQVTLLEASGVAVAKKLIFSGQQYWFQGQYGELPKNQKVSVYLDLQNSTQNQLGIPLPKGTLRVYKADKAGQKQFVGEDAIEHTPRDEKVRVKVGEAFDVVADRKQQSWSSLGNCSSESAWEVELRNHKDEDVSVEVREPAGGDWNIVTSSHPAQRDDANNFHFDVSVPKRGKTKVTYKVRVRWC